MLRYKTETRPGLVALYDIRPGNGVITRYGMGTVLGGRTPVSVLMFAIRAQTDVQLPDLS